MDKSALAQTVGDYAASNDASPFHLVAKALGIFPDQGLGSLFGALISVVITLLAAWYLQRVIPQKLKTAESELSFSRRFQELRQLHHGLNTKFYFDEHGKRREPAPVLTDLDKAEAFNQHSNIFHNLFCLFESFEKRMITLDFFLDQMKWQWYGWNPDRIPPEDSGETALRFEVLGIPYRDGWKKYAGRPIMNTQPFVTFLNAIHQNPTDVDDVRRWVLKWSVRRRKFS